MSAYDVVECPNCGCEHNGLDMIDTGDMEGEFGIDCDGCDGRIDVDFRTAVTFTSEYRGIID